MTRLIQTLLLLAVSSGVAVAAPANPLIRPVAALPQPATTGNPPIPPAPTAPAYSYRAGGQDEGPGTTMTAQELKTAQVALQTLRVVAMEDDMAVLRSAPAKAGAATATPGVSGGLDSGVGVPGQGATSLLLELVVRDGDRVIISGLTLSARVRGGLVQLTHNGALLFQGRVSGGVTTTPVTVIPEDRGYVLRRTQPAKKDGVGTASGAGTGSNAGGVNGSR